MIASFFVRGEIKTAGVATWRRLPAARSVTAFCAAAGDMHRAGLVAIIGGARGPGGRRSAYATGQRRIILANDCLSSGMDDVVCVS